MASSHPRQKRRIEVDVLFAPVPQALVLDKRVSAAACRLWSVLYVFRWNDTPPDFDKLANAMGATDRSVYRWCQELETSNWIGWDRNAGILDRFTLRMNCEPPEIDTGVNSDTEKLTPGSNKLIPRSKRLTQVSEELTQVSISTLFDPLPMPQNDQLSSDQNHEKIQNDDDDDGRTLAFLESEGIGAAHEFAHLPYEPMLIDYQNRVAAGHSAAIIVKAWRSNPPTKDYHYGQQRSPALNGSDPGRNGTGSAHGRTDRARAARAPRPGERAYYQRDRDALAEQLRSQAGTERPADEE